MLKKDGKITVGPILDPNSANHTLFLGTCVEHHFTCRRSVKMLASAKLTIAKEKRKCFSTFLWNTKNFHSAVSPCMYPVQCSLWSADVTATFRTAGAGMQRCQPLVSHYIFLRTLGKATDLWSSQKDCGHCFFPIKHRSLQSTTLSNRTQRSQLCTSGMAQPSSWVLFGKQSMSPSMETVCSTTHSPIRGWGWGGEGVAWCKLSCTFFFYSQCLHLLMWHQHIELVGPESEWDQTWYT